MPPAFSRTIHPLITEVQQFDFSKIKQDTISVYIGGRNTGKSTLVRDVLRRTKHLYDFAVAIVGSNGAHDNCSLFLTKHMIYTAYSDDIVAKYLKACEDCINSGKLRHSILIEDDLFKNAHYLKSDVQSALFLNGRHPKTSKAICCQYAMLIPTNFRGNIDYVFALREPDRNLCEKLHKYFFGCLGTFQEFKAVFDKVTQNHGCLILDKTQSSGNINDMIKFHRAVDDRSTFQLGRPIYFWISKRLDEEERICLLKRKVQGMTTITI